MNTFQEAIGMLSWNSPCYKLNFLLNQKKNKRIEFFWREYKETLESRLVIHE